MKLLEKDLLNLIIQKKRTNPDNLIYNNKSEGIRPKGFRN